ncbi:exported protein of unknown function [endosymbiont DhMRE of Dentiscutata heterogama]|uniref:FlxA-like family protein n=1 Tax=endosymbiont DhMRE of Dentiscutata heterogama TaxID=1609546 RepID=UPI000629DCBC|nr:FlxA-like family protein [endosymbiont DhMRE of Dentiscutata heterogama]CFW93473.1 exported protein of unknown function [endosymbiont DhMRE of Dentiscutata heterogama]
MENSNRRKILKIILVGGLVVALAGGIFWLGQKLGAKNKVNQAKIDQQKAKLEKELQELKEQLQNENDPTKKQELEQKTKTIEQQIQNLGNNSPNPPINPGGNGQQPPINNNKTHRQIAVKYNTEVGAKHEYIDINDNKKRVLIDTKNKIFSSASNLTIKDNQYNFSFYEEDATEKRGNGFIFDENNDNFQLIPITTAPSPSKNPSNDPNFDRIEEEISILPLANDEYIRFSNNIKQGDWDDGKKRPMFILISKKNSVWGGRNWDQTDWRNAPNFKISFLGKDATTHKIMNTGWGEKSEYYFDKNNNNFTLTALGNWPDDNSEPEPIPPPSSQTPPPSQSKKKIVLKMKYMFNSGSDYYVFGGEGRKGKTVFISQKNPSVDNKILKDFVEYEIGFELDPVAENYFETTKIMFFGENDSIEVIEA